MKIDFHAHCNVGDTGVVAAFIERYRAKGLMAALSGGKRYGSVDYQPNEFVLDLSREYPDVVIPLARVDLWDKVDTGEIHELADSGYKGLKFIYPYHPYDHDIYMPIYEAAEELDLPCLFHTGLFRPGECDTRWRRPTLLNMDPLRLDRVARSFQRLNIVIAHMGTSLWRREAAEMIGLHANLYADLAGSGSWMSVSARELRELLNPHHFVSDPGCEKFRKLIFGSDAYVNYPETMESAFSHYEVLLAGVPAEVRDAVMGGTVAGWLGLSS